MKKWLILCLAAFIPMLTAVDRDWEKFKQNVMVHQKSVPGWCVYEKANKLMDLIYETHPQVVVEIGVFGGASVYPMAEALRYLKSGVISAIDPWAAEDCRVGFDSNDANAIWWSQLDHEKIYKDFVKLIKHHRLSKYCNIMRMSSETALSHFADESIDILHIDGNHSEEASMKDVLMYLPKIKKGGYLWFDDANWRETAKTVMYLQQNLKLNIDRSIGNECYLFQKL